jgi:hypothetical protein
MIEEQAWTVRAGQRLSQLREDNAHEAYLDNAQAELSNAIQSVKHLRRCYELPSSEKCQWPPV